MCENCVNSGRMSQEEADAQAVEFGAIMDALGSTNPAEIIGRIAIQQVSEEYVSVLAEYGYEISLGLLESGNIAVGLMHRDAASQGPGYVLAEFSADVFRKLLS